MLEEDYVSLERHSAVSKVPNKTHAISSKIIKEIILPQIEKEVNEGKNFAQLRQIFSGMVLATWYKRALKESLLGKIYADRAKVAGVNQNPANNEKIYQQYLTAFKKGVYNYIKEDVDKYTNQIIPRKYFSGGFEKSKINEAMVVRKVPASDFAQAVFGTSGTTGTERAVVQLKGSEEDRAMTPDVVKIKEEIKRRSLSNTLPPFDELHNKTVTVYLGYQDPSGSPQATMMLRGVVGVTGIRQVERTKEGTKEWTYDFTINGNAVSNDAKNFIILQINRTKNDVIWSKDSHRIIPSTKAVNNAMTTNAGSPKADYFSGRVKYVTSGEYPLHNAVERRLLQRIFSRISLSPKKQNYLMSDKSGNMTRSIVVGKVFNTDSNLIIVQILEDMQDGTVILRNFWKTKNPGDLWKLMNKNERGVLDNRSVTVVPPDWQMLLDSNYARASATTDNFDRVEQLDSIQSTNFVFQMVEISDAQYVQSSNPRDFKLTNVQDQPDLSNPIATYQTSDSTHYVFQSQSNFLFTFSRNLFTGQVSLFDVTDTIPNSIVGRGVSIKEKLNDSKTVSLINAFKSISQKLNVVELNASKQSPTFVRLQDSNIVGPVVIKLPYTMSVKPEIFASWDQPLQKLYSQFPKEISFSIVRLPDGSIVVTDSKGGSRIIGIGEKITLGRSTETEAAHTFYSLRQVNVDRQAVDVSIETTLSKYNLDDPRYAEYKNVLKLATPIVSREHVTVKNNFGEITIYDGNGEANKVSANGLTIEYEQRNQAMTASVMRNGMTVKGMISTAVLALGLGIGAGAQGATSVDKNGDTVIINPTGAQMSEALDKGGVVTFETIKGKAVTVIRIPKTLPSTPSPKAVADEIPAKPVGPIAPDKVDPTPAGFDQQLRQMIDSGGKQGLFLLQHMASFNERLLTAVKEGEIEIGNEMDFKKAIESMQNMNYAVQTFNFNSLSLEQVEKYQTNIDAELKANGFKMPASINLATQYKAAPDIRFTVLRWFNADPTSIAQQFNKTSQQLKMLSPVGSSIKARQDDPTKDPKDNSFFKSSPTGGIDLNAANLNFQIKRDVRGVPLPLNQQDMRILQQIEGFIPTIIEIKPVTTLPMFSQVEGDRTQTLASAS